MFKPVSSKLNVTSMEEGVLKFWKQSEIFKKTVEQRLRASDSIGAASGDLARDAEDDQRLAAAVRRCQLFDRGVVDCVVECSAGLSQIGWPEFRKPPHSFLKTFETRDDPGGR